MFDVNLMESNRDKCHLLVGSREKKKKMEIGNFQIEKSICE